MSDCVLTLGGQCCNDLGTILDFIEELKDINLYDAGRQQCCEGGYVRNEDCDCPDISAWSNPDVCLWEYCLTYNDLKGVLGYFRSNYDAKEPEFKILGYVATLWGFLSSGGSLEFAVSSFAANAGAVLDTLLGLSVAAYVAYHIITAAVFVEADDMATDRYADYGTHGWLGAFMGVVQAIWVTSFLGYTGLMAVAPVKMALDFNFAGTDQNTALYFHILQSIAALVGYYTITEAEDQLFGVYDNGSLNPDYGRVFKNNGALAWDLMNHTLVAIAFSGVAISVALGPFLFAEFTLDPAQFPEWAQRFALDN